MPLYEILSYGRWITTTRWIFRSYTGQRRKNGKTYNGPVYLLGTNVECLKTQARSCA